MTRILIVGTGRMAYHLAHAIVSCGLDLVGVAGRNAQAREQLARFVDRKALDLSKPLPEADLILLAVSDDAIREVSAMLPKGRAVVAHTAGAVGMDLLEGHAHHGVLWPIQSLGHGQPMDLRDVPMVIDAGDAHARAVLTGVASKLSDVVVELPLDQRQRLHLAAVLTSNLTVWLVREGQRLLREQKLPTSLLTPLWRATAQRVAAFGPEQALTGPARRGDRQTIDHHLHLLENDDALRPVYALLSERIMRAFADEQA